MRTANVIGATGLVGRCLVDMLLKDSRFSQVNVFVRNSTGIMHSKLQEHIVDYETPDKWRKLVHGDVLYSAMGTTLKEAGSKDAQYRIDYTYQYQTAKTAANNGVKEYVLISAAGADPKSVIFYSKMKGALEQAVEKLPFEAIHIIRPGMLSGRRTRVRTGEKLAGSVLGLISSIPGLGKLKPVKGEEVARAMINATFCHTSGIHYYPMKDIFKLAQRK